MEEENDLVVVKHPEKEWTVRCVILRACSAVLDGILRDSDPKQPKVLNTEDVSVENVETFLSLATMTSHDRSDGVLTVSDLSRMTVSAMPLVASQIRLQRSSQDAAACTNPAAKH